jgi:hypothetical protein
MDKIPNGGFPPLQLKEKIKKNSKQRAIKSNIKKIVNIRDILVNNQKTSIFEKEKDNLIEVNTL